MAKISVDMRITLLLNAQEAAWLKALLQNYLGPTGEESDKDYDIRTRLFKVLAVVKGLA